MRSLFLGVDGGQSSTTALIGDETGRVLGKGVGSPCNHVGAAEGRQKLARAVRESLDKACMQANLDPRAVRYEAACFGMSGGPADKQAILGEVIPAGILVVTHDALIALAGATGGEPGVITIAGTGSIAFGRNGSGETARAGGWGYLFGDEGGGFDIVRQALRAALRHEEGWGPPTSLHGMLLESSSARDANEALHIFYTLDWPRPRVAALAARVDEAALQGDAVARDILHNAAQNLAALCTSVRSRLWKSGEAARIAYVGGVFRSHMLTERFRMLLELEEGNRCASALHSPAAGALLEAYRSAGLSPNLSNVPAM